MELLDRYLREIRNHLPKEQQEDIIQELSDLLRSQIEDREAELGRPLNDSELEALLTRHGHPVIVAGRYRADSGSLVLGKRMIGPELFPLYVRVLAINVAVTLVAGVVCAFVFGDELPVLRLASRNLVIQCLVVTAIFIGIDRHIRRHPELWNPRGARPGRASRIELIIELVGLSLLVMWWLAVPGLLRPLFGPEGPFRLTGPALPTLYFSLLLLTFDQLVVSAILIVRPAWKRFGATARMLIHTAGAAVGLFCASIGGWVAATGTGDRDVAALFNHWFSVVVTWFAVINLVLALIEAWRLSRMSQPRATAVVV